MARRKPRQQQPKKHHYTTVQQYGRQFVCKWNISQSKLSSKLSIFERTIGSQDVTSQPTHRTKFCFCFFLFQTNCSMHNESRVPRESLDKKLEKSVFFQVLNSSFTNKRKLPEQAKQKKKTSVIFLSVLFLFFNFFKIQWDDMLERKEKRLPTEFGPPGTSVYTKLCAYRGVPYRTLEKSEQRQ